MDEENGSKTDLRLEVSAETINGNFGEDDGSSIQVEDEEKPVQEESNDVGAQSAYTSTLSVGEANVASDTEAVVDFLRSFLSQMGMTDTLDCFQMEYHDLVQTGRLIDAKRVDVMPYVYIQNRHLENELKKAQKEREEYTQAITAAEETVVKITVARDSHRLRHKRLIQEKNKLFEDIRKLTAQCNEYQPKVKHMNEKYEKLVQQTMNVTVERDKALDQAKQKHNKNPQLDSTSSSSNDDDTLL